MAFYGGLPGSRKMGQTLDRAAAAGREFEEAMAAFRQELLHSMARRYPAAARRIVAGLKRNARD
jgi:hypothetical protein